MPGFLGVENAGIFHRIRLIEDIRVRFQPKYL